MNRAARRRQQSIALIAALLLSACGSDDSDDAELSSATGAAGAPACPIEEVPRASSRYRMGELPSGGCDERVPLCQITTSDPCPSTGKAGPLVDWQCRCLRSEWTCMRLGQHGTREACPP